MTASTCSKPDLCNVREKYLGVQIENEYASTEAYILNHFDTSELLYSFGLRLLDENDEDDISYSHALRFRNQLMK